MVFCRNQVRRTPPILLKTGKSDMTSKFSAMTSLLDFFYILVFLLIIEIKVPSNTSEKYYLHLY